MNIAVPNSLPSDEEIERIINSELNWSFFASGIKLIGVLSLTWQKVRPGSDALPGRLVYADDASMHVLIRAECLALEEKHFVVTRDLFLYTLEGLASAGEGPSATPDSFDDLAWDTVDLQEDIDPGIRIAIADFAENEPSDAIPILISRQSNSDEFIQSIKDESTRDIFTRIWSRQRKYYE
jgi:hypothetical protein